jgi:endonuclease/exonuclease/phosphatase family metal-dependent hydrolase
MKPLLIPCAVLIWLLYALARLVPPASMVGALEPIGSAAGIVGLLAGPALAVATLLLALAARGSDARLRRALPILSLAGLVAVLAPRPTSTAHAGGALTVMTWNVGRLGGIQERDGKTAADEAKIRTTACLASRLAIVEPDVLVLTEVSRYDVERILEPALGSLSRRCLHAANDADKQLSAGTLVCAWSGLLSIREQEVVHIAQSGLPDQQLPLVAVVHLPPLHRAPERWPAWSRAGLAAAAQEAMVRTIDAAGTSDWPTVLAGDFNQSRHAWIHGWLRSRYADAWESSRIGPGGTRLIAGQPAARIDYIYADRERLSVVDATVDRAGCSDHDPVVARVRQN